MILSKEYQDKHTTYNTAGHQTEQPCLTAPASDGSQVTQVQCHLPEEMSPQKSSSYESQMLKKVVMIKQKDSFNDFQNGKSELFNL